MKTAKERAEDWYHPDLMVDDVALLIEEHEADVVEAIATWIGSTNVDLRDTPLGALTLREARRLATAIRSGAWRKAGK